MNISEIISDIKDSEGLHAISLPFKEPIEVVLERVIAKSVRTFSDFKRQKKETWVLMKDLKAATDDEKMRNIFLLPTEVCTTPVKDVFCICESSSADKSQISVNTFTVASPFIGFGAYYPQDILNAQLLGTAINKYSAQVSRKPTSKYIGYNKIQLFDFPRDSCVHFIVECEHDVSCESIPESCRESFLELATLDVEIFLYNNLKNMSNVGSGYNQIQIKIDDWSGAKEARKQLIEKWTETYHFDEPEAFMFF